ncbi:hypothetical protein RvY_02018 [Ramazzottius varieornatus]|uniref:WH1 domain-containing protein n=1 Tax=Ramazzottius varieornatus TaxID=947166 RepID=A0A1D1UIB9_RAMVA|nr:hypothetical protein RvY_02018 [Ramazzottius varieornatus]
MMSGESLAHQPCRLLTKQENDTLFSLVPKDCQNICWSVCQVLVTDGPDHRQWSPFATGVVSLLKDFSCRSFFICLFDLTFDNGRGVLLWRQEVYSEMEYVQTTSFAHAFEADTCMVALNFADEQDAQQFYHHVTQKLVALQKKINNSSVPLAQPADKIPKTAPGSVFPSNTSGLPKPYPGQAASSYLLGVQAPVSRSTESLASTGKKTLRFKSKNKKGRVLDKTEIGEPTDFRHVSHIGWDPKGELSFDEHDPLVLWLLNKAGIDVSGKDAKEKEFIYNFIQQNLGGVEGIRRRTVKTDHSRKLSPIPPPRISSTTTGIKPGRVEQSPPTVQERPPPVAPPPPPPPPPLVYHDVEEPKATDALYESLPPPPPPPPPLLLAPPAPRRALLDAISEGFTLRKSASENVLTESRPLTDRDKLMSDIRTKHALRPVLSHTTTTSRPSSNEEVGLDTMAQILSRALAQRREAVALQDDNGNQTEEDDEWEV